MGIAYEQALSEVGNEGKFQKCFDVKYNVLVVFLWSMAYMNIILALAFTPYTCKLPDKTDINISDYTWKLKHIPVHTDANGDVKFESCTIYKHPDVNNETMECNSYTYDQTWYESTIASEKNWVCDKEINIANLFAFSKIGEAFGSVVFGWIGDVFGRRPTYMISMLLIVLGRLISLMAGSSFFIFATGCIIASSPSWSVPQSVSVISMEISSSTRRTTTTSMRYTAFSIGLATVSLFYWWLRDWKLFVIITTAPLIPWIIFSWKIPESPRWLCVTGKSKQCIKCLKKIAKDNNRDLEVDTEKELMAIEIEESNSGFGPLALFSGKRLALNTILLLILWVFISISYSVLVLSAGEKSGLNPFIQFSLQSIAEIPANFLGAWLCDHLGRRRSVTMSFFVIATIWTLISLRELTNMQWIRAWWIHSVLIGIGRLIISISFFAINLLNLEIYPTSLRSSGLSLGNVVSSAAAAIAPYILYLGRRVDSRLPGIILASTCFLSVFTSIFLPETMNTKLPETIEDANLLGSNKSKYSKVSESKQPAPEDLT
ncbi:unnamed protein product [Colias eurytheme]|nr:unnamed protein product [Colias eurytheme]